MSSYEEQNRQEHAKIIDVLTETNLSIARIATSQEAMAEKLDVACKTLQDHQRWIHGNGAIGAKTELDRLKQSEKRRVWTMRMLIGTTCTMLASVGGLMIKFFFFA